MAEQLLPASISSALLLILATRYIVYLFDTFVGSNLKQIPATSWELAIPYYSVFRQVTGTLKDKISTAHDHNGSIVRITPDHISIANPDTLQDLLKVTDLPKHRGTYEGLAQHGRPGIVRTLDRADHKRLRRVISPAFSVKYLMNLESYLIKVYNAFERKILRCQKTLTVVSQWTFFIFSNFALISFIH
ncbi:hypothetical protein M427DRAFT_32397 [Gonapodya prolifera JEL478]|uniref:Cytochrome P450 n=1 Tax=Gonapodya prolifera (strain JEL478) TaxID=1344416 RepID=A0A139AFH7_GONPJ|nr:hypothetical protein M427DRAFT_32397 [Gonapodya prolifera JEL478]|eukprot:KXS15449.1 hypothetical protein M427DRAFT_32397 [Gonapodya prolifera JEL478]